MRFSLALFGACASLAMAQSAPAYDSTVVLTTISYYTQTIAPSTSSSTSCTTTESPSVSVYKQTSKSPVVTSASTPKTTTCTTLKKTTVTVVPYYTATGIAPIPLSPTTYYSSVASQATAPTAAPTYVGAGSNNAASFGGVVAIAALVAALV